VKRELEMIRMKLLDFSIDLILPAALWRMITQTVTQMDTRNLPGG
jgi:hypothetical protein